MAEGATAGVVGATTTLERATPWPTPQMPPQTGGGPATARDAHRQRGGQRPNGAQRSGGIQRPAGALGLVRSRYAELPRALQRVAETVLLDPPAAAGGTIVELAERSGTSASTVTRFCRAIGFEGFAGLRLGLRDGGPAAGVSNGIAAQIGWTAARGSGAAATDPLERMLEQIVADDMIAVRETLTLLDLSEVARAADLISRAERVEIYAAAGSAGVGKQLREGLGLLAPQSGELGPRDAAMGISRSGHAHDTVDRLAKARAQGAKTIALTSFPHSPLADVADIVLLTTTLRRQALSARHSQLMVLDLLRAAVAQLIQGAG